MPRLYQKEEGRGKKEEGRGKREEGRRKREEKSISYRLPITVLIWRSQI
ncbi:hypothetical protein K4039_16880 [Lyngbya sp. CCAP 1446/10]|nr:hypothetical protein [Lyngbya sp. CCAP 1446/10]MCW6051719.1 hypothetical protein [Lyngbya sp. CCAP 1446/10]